MSELSAAVAELLPAAYTDLVARLTRQAAGHGLPQADALKAFELLTESEAAKASAIPPAASEDETPFEEPVDETDSFEAPAAEVFLAALTQAGVELVDDDEDFAAVQAQAVKILRLEAAATDDGGSLDAQTQYLREVGNHRILSRDEETVYTFRLAFLYRTTAALRTSRDRLVTARDEGELFEDAALDEVARAIDEIDANLSEIEIEKRRLESEFIGFNLKLVIKWAVKIYGKSGRKVEMLELISAGNEGMVESLRKFDPALGFKFSTYAIWQIRERMTSFSYEQGPSMLVKQHRQRDLARLRRLRQAFMAEHGRLMSAEELVVAMDRTPDQIAKIIEAELALNAGSLDKPVGDDDGSASLGDLVPDASAIDPALFLERSDTSAKVSDVLERALNARERRVIMMRFGLYDRVSRRTLEAVGLRMGVTRERVRQIEQRALSKLNAENSVRDLSGQPERTIRSRWAPEARPTVVRRPEPVLVESVLRRVA